MKKNYIYLVILMLIFQAGCSTVKSVSDTPVKSNTVVSTKSNIRNEQIVQVVEPVLENITGTEQIWLGHQIQDKLKSNLQDYLGMNVVVDSKLEAELKKLQRESESEARDESSAIELGKITTAKYALFSKIRKTNNGYIISVDYTDLTTGEQKAFVTSKEYTRSEYLYGNTGAVDEITLNLGDKLGIQISDIYRRALTNGTADFTVEAQIELAEQNEAQYQRLMQQLNEQLSSLRFSANISAEEDRRKIEAEKALLEEKQNSEAKRKSELEEQKYNSTLDAKKEKERSIEFITKRDEIAELAAEKASLIRQLQKDKQGVLAQINSLENKKKVLVEIRQNVESQCQAFYKQYLNDKAEETEKIRNKQYSTVELENGEPTKAAKQRRENQINAVSETLYNKFIENSKSIKNATSAQEKSLLTEIRSDQNNLSKERTVSSLGDELKVSYGNYSGENNGWNAFVSLYSDGVLLFSDNFIISYESITKKKAPDIATELNDSVVNEYVNTVEMYNSLFARGTPLLRFELDYNVLCENDDYPSKYSFNAKKIRIYSVLNEELIQNTSLNKKISRTMKPEYDIRDVFGIVEQQEAIRKKALEIQNAMNQLGVKMVKIPTKNIEMLETEVTQKLYMAVVGNNPSKFKGNLNPVESITWYQAIFFCNKLSKKIGLTPVYSIGGVTDVDKWQWAKGDLVGTIRQNESADGFRLPTNEEWIFAAKGGESFKFSGSDNLEEVGWSNKFGQKTHPVAQKKQNGYGLFDMSGNVSEWSSDSPDEGYKIKRFIMGGSYASYNDSCTVESKYWLSDYASDDEVGFRVVRTIKE